MRQFSYGDFCVRKRKGREVASESTSKTGERESSSSSANKGKKGKIVAEWMSAGTEEVGDSDDLHLLRKELLEQTSAPRKVKNECVHLCERGMAMDSTLAVSVEENHKKHETDKPIDADRFPKFKETSPVTPTGRSYMENILGELQEARRQLFQWMRQEMHGILGKRSGSPSVPKGLVSRNGVNMGFEEGSRWRSMAASFPNCGAIPSQFGDQGIVIGHEGLSGHCIGNNVGYRCHHGILNSILGRNPTRGTEDVTRDEHADSLGMVLTAQKIAPSDNVPGSTRSKWIDIQEQSTESRRIVGLQDLKARFVGLGGKSGGEEGWGFSLQPDLQRDTEPGALADSRSGGEMRYGVHGCGSAAIMFSTEATEDVGDGGGQIITDVRSSVDPNQESFFRTTAIESIDGGSMHEMQNPVALNTVRNEMQHAILDSTVSNFNHSSSGRVFNGGMGSYGGFVSIGSGFESSSGIVNSVVMQNANGAFGVQLPLSAQNSSLQHNSSDMPILIGVQNQVAVHNSSSLQNFLGLSMNDLAVGAAADRRSFLCDYLQENAHHNLPSNKEASLTTSFRLHAVAHETGHAM